MVAGYYVHGEYGTVGVVRIGCDRNTMPHTWYPLWGNKAVSDE